MSRRNGSALLVVLLAVLAIAVIFTIRATTKSPAQVRREKAMENAGRIAGEMNEYA